MLISDAFRPVATCIDNVYLRDMQVKPGSPEIDAGYPCDIVALMPDGSEESQMPGHIVRAHIDLWRRFAAAVKRKDPESNRSANLRSYMRWFVGDTDEMPQRPERPR
jgi:hypothetical protein